MILRALETTTDDWLAGTGWELKPEGACRGEVCVPLPAGAVRGDRVDVGPVAEALGMVVVHDAARGLHAVGPETIGGHALPTATAAELELPDLDGRPFRLSSLRGQKVLLVAWAPY